MPEHYSAHPVMFKNNPLKFVLFCLLCLLAIGIPLLLWWRLQTRGSKLSIDDTDILFEQGIMSKIRYEVNISSVRTVRVEQSFFNRVFGVGNISIFTSGDSPEIVANGMPDPNKIRDVIKSQQAKMGINPPEKEDKE